ncbi:hypothetical protein [Spiroplasma endosymbiont of Melieria omissa]|uniref:hypothetical protein n=1 Tax=Spiroplasma endosymbiont of Melieria omissa TaxID=3139324 RepID=UPI003CCB28CA
MKTKKLQLITVSIFILTILIMIIGLILIGFSDFHDYFNGKWKYGNGFKILNYYGLSYIINHSSNYLCSLCNSYENYYDLIKLQIGVIFCVILVPILTSITMSLTFLILGLKIKIKNNNFWDAIQNCEIISNYYMH